jgi:hypothetical protein
MPAFSVFDPDLVQVERWAAWQAVLIIRWQESFLR